MIYDYQEDVATTGDMPQAKGNLPLWYIREPNGFNQYLWVDHGTTLDYAVGGGNDWNSEGFDAEKHFFIAEDGTNWKIRNRGADTTWSFSASCSTIEFYKLEDHPEQCNFGSNNHPQNCGRNVLLDFSLSASVPKIVGIWDVESAGDEWTGDNAF